MKTYRQLINEITGVPPIGKQPYFKKIDPKDYRHDYRKLEKISDFHQSLKDGTTKKFHVMKARSYGIGTEFLFVDPETKQEHLRIEGILEKHKGKSSFGFIVGGLYAPSKGQVRAVDAYRHLMKHHGAHLVSDQEQTAKGAKVWKKMLSQKDVEGYRIVPDFYQEKKKKETPIVSKNLHSRYGIAGTGDKKGASHFVMGYNQHYQGDDSRLVAYMKGKRK